jgi:methionyl-tRNA synthetase
MSRRRFYITTAIPFVNGDPHLGFALECVQADVLARHRRLRGERVRFLSGTDDNSLKNVEAAELAGVPVAEFVGAKAERFARSLSSRMRRLVFEFGGVPVSG